MQGAAARHGSRIGISPSLKEGMYRLYMAMTNCDVQRGLAILVPLIGREALTQKPFYHRHMPRPVPPSAKASHHSHPADSNLPALSEP
jgi:hypothetical protein